MAILQAYSTRRARTCRVSVVVPAFNEEKSIGSVLSEVRKLQKVLPSMEVVVVDDGSSDETFIEATKFSFVKIVRHKKNRGKGAALSTGFKAARGEVLAIQDADMEYSPLEIPKMLKPILEGEADVVFGSRLLGQRHNMSISHYAANRILSRTVSLLYHKKVSDVMTGHKCLLRKAFDSIEIREEGFGIEVEITAKLLKNGWRFVEVPISYSRRMHGRSKIGFIDGVRSMKKIISDYVT